MLRLKAMNKNHIIIFAIVILAVIGVFVFINNNSGDNSVSSNLSASLNSEGGGGDVVLRVGEEEITRAEFQVQADRTGQALAAQGQGDPSSDAFRNQVRRQTIDQMIAEILLLQEAEAEGFSVNPSEVETQYRGVLQQIGGEEQLSQRLEEVDSSKEILREDIEDQILIQKYINRQVEEEGITVSDDEVDSFYAQLDSQRENVPELSEIESQIRSQLLQQKTNQLVSSLVDELRSEADIEILL